MDLTIHTPLSLSLPPPPYVLQYFLAELQEGRPLLNETIRLAIVFRLRSSPSPIAIRSAALHSLGRAPLHVCKALASPDSRRSGDTRFSSYPVQVLTVTPVIGQHLCHPVGQTAVLSLRFL